MNDPHVVSLTYAFDHDAGVDYSRAASVDYDTPECIAHLDREFLRLTLRQHHATATGARAAVEPLITAWTVASSLDAPDRRVAFRFLHYELIDRAPSVGGLLAGATLVATATVTGSATVSCGALPSPPRAFRATPLIEAMLAQYQVARDHPRICAAAAYFCLTAAKTRVRRPEWKGKAASDNVAVALALDVAILDNMWRLSTDVGGLHTGRKVSDKAEIDRPRAGHSQRDLAWLCEAMRLLTKRLGEWEAHSGGLKPLGMSDLPPL